MKSFKDHLPLIAAMGSMFIWAFTTFATVSYVDAKHGEVLRFMERIDINIGGLRQEIIDIIKDK